MIGEIVAGLLLGPSFFGWIGPALYARLFPAASLPVLNELSQIGLILFMFLIGLHLDLTEVYALRRAVGFASLLSIVVVELIVLNVGLDLGILPPALFSMVIMALVTTPLLKVVLPEQYRRAALKVA